MIIWFLFFLQGGKEKKGHKHHEELKRKVETLTGQMEDMQHEIDKLKWMEKKKDRATTKSNIYYFIVLAFFSFVIGRFIR